MGLFFDEPKKKRRGPKRYSPQWWDKKINSAKTPAEKKKVLESYKIFRQKNSRAKEINEDFEKMKKELNKIY